MSRVRRNPDSPDSVRARLAIIATERQAEFQTVLASTFDFDGRLLAKSIAATFRHRGTRPPDERPLALTPLFMADPSRAVQWKAFLRRSRLEAQPDPARVVEIVELFIWPPLTAFRDDRLFISTWSAGGPWAEGRTV